MEGFALSLPLFPSFGCFFTHFRPLFSPPGLTDRLSLFLKNSQLFLPPVLLLKRFKSRLFRRVTFVPFGVRSNPPYPALSCHPGLQLKIKGNHRFKDSSALFAFSFHVESFESVTCESMIVSWPELQAEKKGDYDSIQTLNHGDARLAPLATTEK